MAPQLELGYLLVLSGRVVESATARAPVTEGLGASDLNALYELCIHGPLHAGAFAQLLNVQQPAVTATADRLAAHGLLKRTRDHGDRRRVWLTATEEGHATVRRARAVVDPQVEAALAGLTPGVRTALTALLGELVEPWVEHRIGRHPASGAAGGSQRASGGSIDSHAPASRDTP